MARGSKQATTGATSAQNLSNDLQGRSSSLYGALIPQLESEAAHPAGYSPTDLAAQNTAAQQTAGGATAAAVGRGSLLQSRTRNAGTGNAATADAARSAGEALSERSVGIQANNAGLKERQRQLGLGGLESLYGTNVGSSVGALGQVASNVNANTEAENASWNWAKYILDPALQAGGQAAGAYAKGASGGGG